LETLEDAERERRPLDVKSPEAADPAASGALESADEDDFEIEGDLSGAPPPAPSSGGFEDSWNAARGVAGESLWEESPPAPAEAPKAAEAARGEDPSGSPSAGGAAPDPEDDLDGDGGEAPKEYLVEEDDLDGGGSGDDFGSLLRAEESKAGSIGRPAETDGGTGGEPDAGSKAPAAAADTETVAADRTRFLESLLDGSDTSLPKKVELDLDGIFDQAKKEAEALAPDATRVPAEAPKVEEGADALAAATAGETPAPPPEPLPPPAQKKVSKLKLLFFLAPIVLGVAGLIFGLYRIFGSGGAPEETPELVLTDPLEIDGEPQPGELAMPSFLLTLEGDDGKRAVAQVDFIIHYHDRPDLDLLKDNMVQVRDIFYRITKSRGPMILTDATARRQLQADLLSTLNDLPPFKTESDPRVTYVQISLLREK
jgi:flagellar basal body-associated protein FliL